MPRLRVNRGLYISVPPAIRDADKCCMYQNEWRAFGMVRQRRQVPIYCVCADKGVKPTPKSIFLLPSSSIH